MVQTSLALMRGRPSKVTCPRCRLLSWQFGLSDWWPVHYAKKRQRSANSHMNRQAMLSREGAAYMLDVQGASKRLITRVFEQEF